jgi:hypothetical protein
MLRYFGMKLSPQEPKTTRNFGGAHRPRTQLWKPWKAGTAGKFVRNSVRSWPVLTWNRKSPAAAGGMAAAGPVLQGREWWRPGWCASRQLGRWISIPEIRLDAAILVAYLVRYNVATQRIGFVMLRAFLQVPTTRLLTMANRILQESRMGGCDPHATRSDELSRMQHDNSVARSDPELT